MMLVGYPPFTGHDENEIYESIKKGTYSMDGPEWEAISDEGKSLVRRLLQYDPEFRISVHDALQHPWFTEFMKKEKVSKHLAKGALKNLQNFRAEEKLKQATLSFILTQLVDQEELTKMEAIFKAMDVNNDGTLDLDELKAGYEEHFGAAIDDDEIERMFKAIDTDNSGNIDYEEFLMATMNETALLSDDKLKTAFDMFFIG